MSGAVSMRTQVRDAVVAALGHITDSPSARVPGAQIVTAFATTEELKKSPTYCVVVTNEDLTLLTQQAADSRMTVLVVVYVKSDGDLRAVLDAAIDDVWDTIRMAQSLRPIVSHMQLDSIETDEGTTIAKPFAQAVMRWTAHTRRTVSW